jgi:hypothetical protein
MVLTAVTIISSWHVTLHGLVKAYPASSFMVEE